MGVIMYGLVSGAKLRDAGLWAESAMWQPRLSCFQVPFRVV